MAWRIVAFPTRTFCAGQLPWLNPFWSPDGRFLAFSADGTLKKIDASGGPPLTLADGSAAFGTWNREDVILFGNGLDPLSRVSASSGAPSPVTKTDTASGDTGHNAPFVLPDGRQMAE